MDRSAVERIVIEHLPAISRQLGLGHWAISVGFDQTLGMCDEGVTRGECSRLIDYQSAHLVFNPGAFEDAEAVLTTLRHELFHIVLAPFDLYTSAVERLELPDVAEELLARISDHATERCVAALERMHEGLTRGNE
jgi:hypothetical protein